ncbi:MAG: hypothetical protein OHK0048_07210 [Rhodoferax sp.]
MSRPNSADNPVPIDATDPITEPSTMLARLLRRLYLGQLLLGAALGYWAASDAPSAAQRSLALVLGALALPLALQAVILGTGMVWAHAGRLDRLAWRALWGEYRAAVRVFMLRMPWSWRAPDVLRPPKATALPVLLVHGYGCNHRVWDELSADLLAAGHPVLCVDLEPTFTGIDDYAAVLEQAVQRLMAATGARRLAMVGHSMGGLAIRAWARAHGHERVACWLTLGTPHQGTRIAHAAHTPNGVQMRWQSPWLRMLQATQDPALARKLAIAITPQDNVVFPQRAQTLGTAPVTEFAGLGHLELALAPAVRQWVLQHLALNRPAHDTAA